MKSSITYSFKAYLTLLPTKDGGRKTGIMDGYRPNFSFNTKKMYCGIIALKADKEIKPGTSDAADIHLLSAETIPKELSKGDTFSIKEGNHNIGSGQIISVYNN